jgi:hypothetical protein
MDARVASESARFDPSSRLEKPISAARPSPNAKSMAINYGARYRLTKSWRSKLAFELLEIKPIILEFNPGMDNRPISN